MKPIITYHESHDSTFCVYDFDKDDIIIIDLEKVTNKKHFFMFTGTKVGRFEWHNSIVRYGLHFLEEQFGIKNDFSAFVIRDYRREHLNFDHEIIKTENLIIRTNDDDWHHHKMHAYNTYGQSQMKKAFCITWDGVGDDTGFATTKIDQNGNTQEFKKYVYDFGYNYSYAGKKIPFLQASNIMDVAGKLMGYAPYGKACEKTDVWKSVLRKTARFRLSLEEIKDYESDTQQQQRRDGYSDEKVFSANGFVNENKQRRLDLWAKHNLVQSGLTASPEISENWAYANQEFIEESFVEFVESVYDEIMEQSGNLILSGGSALNVSVNEVVRKHFPKINVFVGCSPNDSGLSFGLMYKYLLDNKIISAEKRFDIRYSGMRIFDYHAMNLCVENQHSRKVNSDIIARLLKKGKIIALMQGRHEIGPRALGNRSILCDPSFPEMKHILNSKVKKREWYRPYAPVCRLEDVDKYFNCARNDNLEYMSYAVSVKEEHQETYPAITHVDGTARVQSVTKESNSLLYDILGKTSGVLLNTSLNVQGKPICNRFDDALELLVDTKLDYLVVENEEKELILFERLALQGQTVPAIFD